MRLAVVLVTVGMLSSWTACSSAKREDANTMKNKVGDAPTADPGKPGVVPKVYLSTPSGEVAVNVEVVSTEPKIEKGLMFRQHLPPDDGMLFLMGKERNWSFWMRNTLIPLDMLFITRDMTVAGIVENAEPKTETLRTVNKPSVYVLEVNGGWTRAHNVVAGAKVRFENVQ